MVILGFARPADDMPLQCLYPVPPRLVTAERHKVIDLVRGVAKRRDCGGCRFRGDGWRGVFRPGVAPLLNGYLVGGGYLSRLGERHLANAAQPLIRALVANANALHPGL